MLERIGRLRLAPG